MKNSKLLLISLSLILIGFVGLFVTSYFYYSWPSTNTTSSRLNKNPMQNMMKNMMGGRSTIRKKSSRTKFSSNGERIYYTATSRSKKPITAQIGMMRMSSPPMACVDCHGEDGKGGTIRMMMGNFRAPNITYKELAEDEKHTDEDIKKAITKGIEPDGKELNFPMPRWSMAKEDLNDLINYLKTL